MVKTKHRITTEPKPFMALVAGIIIGAGVVNVYNEVNRFYTVEPVEVLCKNGKTFEQINPDSQVYISKDTECFIETGYTTT